MLDAGHGEMLVFKCQVYKFVFGMKTMPSTCFPVLHALNYHTEKNQILTSLTTFQTKIYKLTLTINTS